MNIIYFKSTQPPKGDQSSNDIALEPHEDTELSTWVTAGMHGPAMKIEFDKNYAQTENQTRVERNSICTENNENFVIQIYIGLWVSRERPGVVLTRTVGADNGIKTASRIHHNRHLNN